MLIFDVLANAYFDVFDIFICLVFSTLLRTKGAHSHTHKTRSVQISTHHCSGSLAVAGEAVAQATLPAVAQPPRRNAATTTELMLARLP